MHQEDGKQHRNYWSDQHLLQNALPEHPCLGLQLVTNLPPGPLASGNLLSLTKALISMRPMERQHDPLSCCDRPDLEYRIRIRSDLRPRNGQPVYPRVCSNRPGLKCQSRICSNSSPHNARSVSPRMLAALPTTLGHAQRLVCLECTPRKHSSLTCSEARAHHLTARSESYPPGMNASVTGYSLHTMPTSVPQYPTP